jgi:hypothetical protein
MPSSITLTVSHLPTSTSFFLSALQPLDYAYRGRTGQTIGFGSAVDKKAPTDFWITQEIPGVPAGAAHVAFSAPSRAAVQDFFVAALRAGGKIHGEPCVRDASGYFSGAVIDFDGNSIEAVYRPTFSDDKENDAKSMVSRMSSVRAPSSIGRNSVSRTPSDLYAAPPPSARNEGVVDNILAEARNAADVARNLVEQVRQHNSPTPQSNNNGGSSSGAVIGTLLGVAAGAALHYAFTNISNQKPPSVGGPSATDPPPQPEYSDYPQSSQPRAIEAPPSSNHPKMITMYDNDNTSESASIIRPRRSSSVSGRSTASRRTSTRMIEGPPPTSYKAPTVLTTAPSRNDDRSSRSRALSSSRRPRSRSHSAGDRAIVRFTETVTSAARYPLPSSVASSKRSSRVLSPTRYPLPASVASSNRSTRVPSPSRYPLPASVASSNRSTLFPSPTRYPLPASTTSKASTARTAFRDREPEEYPLPPSRASTWVGSTTSKRESRSGRSHMTSDSRSVISKAEDLKKLDLPRGELTPDDSVSQISVARSERSRRSGRSGRSGR